MANIQNTGFRPAFKLGGGAVPVMRFPIDATQNAATIFIGDVLIVEGTAGSVKRGAANSGATVIGVCVGLFDTNGIAIGSPGAAVSTKYMPASTAGYADVALALPDCVFIAPAGSTSIAATALFGTVDHVNTAGDTTTGRSGHVLNGSAVNTEGQCQILGLVNDPLNSWGTYVDLYVRFNESVWGQTGSSVGV